MANKKLTSPDINPQVFVLTGASADAKTSFYMNDSCGIASQTGLVDTTNGVAFAIGNGFTINNLRSFLQTYALLISEYRFLADDENDLVNNLNLIRCAIDGQSEKEIAFSADATSPFANNPNLLLIKRPFVLTALTALKISVAAGAGHNYTLTFTVKSMIPYGQLDSFLNENPIMV